MVSTSSLRASAPRLEFLPFDPLPPVDAARLRAIEAAALEANERYLVEVIEEHSFCPFARGGRAQNQTARFVHYADSLELTPLFDLMARLAKETSKVVVQVIFPLIEASDKAWTRFCHELTAAGHVRMAGDGASSRDITRRPEDVYAVAPLHPTLEYNAENPFALVPLFRRAPNPTIQWVRLDGLRELYKGRSRSTVFVNMADIDAFLAQKFRPPLLDRIAETNMQMAMWLGLEQVEGAFAEISKTAQRRYHEILLAADDEALEAKPRSRCPGHCSSPETAEEQAPAHTPITELQDGSWGIVRVRDLTQRRPHHVLVEGVDLVIVRMGEHIHVLYGRCPHRLAYLSGAIVEDQRLVCSHHGWDFRLDTGESEGVPGESVHRFQARISDGILWIEDAELEQWRMANPQAFEVTDLIS